MIKVDLMEKIGSVKTRVEVMDKLLKPEKTKTKTHTKNTHNTQEQYLHSFFHKIRYTLE